MSIVKPVRPKTLLAAFSVVVVVAGMLFGARVAVADSVWYQSYGRVSQSEACAAQVGETPWQASWGRSHRPVAVLRQGLIALVVPVLVVAWCS